MHLSPSGTFWTSYKFLAEQFERRLKQAVDAAARFDKLITSFSAGGIVFSATLLPASWAFFLLAIVCVAPLLHIPSNRWLIRKRSKLPTRLLKCPTIRNWRLRLNAVMKVSR